MDLIVFATLLGLGFVVGRIVEQRHFASLRRREQALASLPLLTVRPVDEDFTDATLVSGSVVVSIDYFKRVWAGLRNLIGGRVRAYETVIDRGRREAIQRMKEEAAAWGADLIFNLRIETSQIGATGGRNKGLGASEVVAYATAVRRQSPALRP